VTEIVPGVTADPSRAFDGARLPAATVLNLLAAGRLEAEILAEYDLTSEQIRDWLQPQERVFRRLSLRPLLTTSEP
jgi:uncharacterized protein (DUF433 family)